MLKLKIITLIFAIKNLLSPGLSERKISGFHTSRKEYKIEKTGMLPDSVLESSALELANENTFWTVGDGGSKNQLFELDSKGKVVSIFPLKGIKNNDWEALAKDERGNLYVCDIGNNTNRRKDLKIYKIKVNENRIDTIHYRYPDQLLFPPEKNEMNFDCEGVFWCNDHLYLISKNRGNKNVKIYKIPDHPGTYVAQITDCIFMKSQVTAADISPDRQSVAMLSYGKIYFFKTEEGSSLKLKPYLIRKFDRSAQGEAIVFINNSDLLITNEQRQVFLMKKKKKGG